MALQIFGVKTELVEVVEKCWPFLRRGTPVDNMDSARRAEAGRKFRKKPPMEDMALQAWQTRPSLRATEAREECGMERKDQASGRNETQHLHVNWEPENTQTIITSRF